MKKLSVDFDEIQKAMEDTARDAFDYFLDLRTGDVIILSEDIISKALSILEGHFDEDLSEYEAVEFDEVCEMPDWMEDEIELAMNIFLNDKDGYSRIPERDPQKGFAAMKEFADGIENISLQNKLLEVLDGKGAFRNFKDTLEPYPRERKLWYGFNSKAARREIEEWLASIGIARTSENTMTFRDCSGL